MIIDTRKGDVVARARLGDDWAEFFDVGVISSTRCPMAVAPNGSDMEDAIT